MKKKHDLDENRIPKFKATKMLIKGSWRVIKTDKKILLIPAAAGTINLLLVGMMFLINSNLRYIHSADNGPFGWIASLAILLVFYLVTYTISNYFNVAFLSIVSKRLKGESSGIVDGFELANKKISTIFYYSLIAATIGGIIDKTTESLPLIPSVVSFMVGVAWSLVSIFTIPVIVTTDQKPIEAIKSSARTIKDKWGEVVLGDWLVLGLLGLLSFTIFIMIPISVGFTLYHLTDPQMSFELAGMQLVSAIVAGGVSILMFLLSLMLLSAVRRIFFMALYLDATTGFSPSVFDEQLYRQAFRPKKKLFS